MVKIRLRRMGAKGKPFYRVVVAHSTAGRNSKFVETIGTYDPLRRPKLVEIDADRALHWLSQGAQPTETTAYLLSKIGVLDRHFEQRPAAKASYKFLDKRTAATSVQSAIPAAPPEPKPEPKPETKAEPAEAPPPTPGAQAAEPEPVEEPQPEPESTAPQPEPEGTAPEGEPETKE